MKQKLLSAWLVVCMLISLFPAVPVAANAFTAEIIIARYEDGEFHTGGVQTVLLAEESVTVLELLQTAKEAGILDFTSEDSGYGETVTSMNGRNEAGAYWMYTVNDATVWDGISIATVKSGDCLLFYEGTAENNYTAPYWSDFTDMPSASPAALPTESPTEPPEGIHQPEAVMHKIARRYVKQGIVSDANALWLAMDMGAYRGLAEDADCLLPASEVQAVLDKIIDTVDQSGTAADLTKCILALRALGYDAETVVTADSRTLYPVKQLVDLAESESESVTNIYTLPYVLLALEQGEGYLTEQAEQVLLSAAVSQKEAWQELSWGTDTAAPYLAALAPYAAREDIAAIIEETKQIILSEQEESGLIGNAASTALVVVSLSALGIDAEEIRSGEKSLISGMMTGASETGDGFLPLTNSFSTEQGFRGLIAWQLQKNGSLSGMYDWRTNPKNPAIASGEPEYTGCPVTFSVTPGEAVVSVSGQTPNNRQIYDLPEGVYSFTVTYPGYRTESGEVTVSGEEAETHTPKTVTVSLTKNSGSGSDIADSFTVYVTVTGDTVHEEGQHKSAPTWVKRRAIQGKSGMTAYDAIIEALSEGGCTFSATGGYIDSVTSKDGVTLAEFTNGANAGWLYKVGAKAGDIPMAEYELKSGSNVIFYYCDDYTKDSGSSKWSGGSQPSARPSASVSPTEAPTASPLPSPTELPFSDIETHWAKPYIVSAFTNGWMTGITSTRFAPEETVTRGMMVTVLYRMSRETAQTLPPFSDVEASDWYYDAVAWAAERGIVKGVSETEFAPNAPVTRQDMVTMLYRYAACLRAVSETEEAEKTAFRDHAEVASYALPAVMWAWKNGIIRGKTEGCFCPKDTATRAELAAVLARGLYN